ncbi:protein of unknown function (plasmid) [Methylocella tundrae]|uniref:Uncharacterized protein n=1 Tax=Methylocella tundrae TaxID=227605 RepID=A0A4V6INB5_METTU|nr:protein of unknown function [Methylocella tundrae]
MRILAGRAGLPEMARARRRAPSDLFVGRLAKHSEADLIDFTRLSFAFARTRGALCQNT